MSIDSSEVVIAPDDSTTPRRILSVGESSHLEIERDARLRSISMAIGAGLGMLAGAAYYEFDWCRSDKRACALEQHRVNEAALDGQAYVGMGTILIIAGTLAGGAIGYFLAPASHWAIVAAAAPQPDPSGTNTSALRIGVSHRFFGR